MKILETTKARLVTFSTIFASLAVIGAFMGNVDQAVDDAIMTPAEHAADVQGLSATLGSIDNKLDRSAAREAVVAIRNIMAGACEGDGTISERGQEVIEEQLRIYSSYYDKELAIGVCHDGKYISRANARLLGL